MYSISNMDLVGISPMLAEEIIPLEVWDFILSPLRSATDLSNCSEVCKAWKKLLELKKTTFLMPKVFPILYKYLETVEHNEKAEKYEDEETDEDEEDKYENAKAETITTILKMRLVSYGWKESVDNYHQKNPALNNIGFPPLTKENPADIENDFQPFPLLPYNFCWETKSTARLESFLGKGFSPDANPFITRCVRYSDSFYSQDDDPQQSELQIAFINMLEAFGSHIWTYELFLMTNTNKVNVNLYKLVRSHLILMPNLRSLKLEFIGMYNKGKRKGNSEQEELEMLLQNEPIPRLEHLTKLEMRDMPYLLSVGILRNNGHLQKLLFSSGSPYSDELSPDYIPNVELSSLKQLTFPNCYNACLQFPKVLWPIKRLDINVELTELKDVFQVVSSTFGNTLEHFVLTRNGPLISDNNEELRQIRLELPKLKIFQLDIPIELETIDFLQGCAALQEIQLAIKVPLSSSPTDEEENAVIKFKDCITSMNQSNILRILDNLQSIIIQTNAIVCGWDYIETMHLVKTRKFTRRQFEKFSNSN